MTYHPDIHHRRTIRLRDYDYSSAGAYFVTICTGQRECLFGEVVGGVMRVNECGQTVTTIWDSLPQRYPGLEVDAFVVMPNHLHGIIVIHPVGAIHESPGLSESSDCRELPGVNGSTGAIHELPLRRRRAMLLSKVVGFLKMNSAKRINQWRDNPGAAVWQRNYHEHVIRDEGDLAAIRDYIASNPSRWDEDEYRLQTT